MDRSHENPEFAIYIENVLTRMEGYDWSRYGDLGDATSGTVKAAALVLWRHNMRTPDPHRVCAVMRAKIAEYSDESFLCTDQKDVRDFLDKADEFKLPSWVLANLHDHLSRTVLERHKAKGNHVVSLTPRLRGGRVTSQEEGYYIFSGEGVDKAVNA